MPFPNWTLAECETEIQRIDAEIAEIRPLATSFAVGAKSFNYAGKLEALKGERAEWYGRWRALGGVEIPQFQGSLLQGPRFRQ